MKAYGFDETEEVETMVEMTVDEDGVATVTSVIVVDKDDSE